MIRILHIFHTMGNGGIEHFVMNYYRHIDRTKVQFDFLVSVETEGYFDKEIQKLGGKVYHAYPFKKNPIKNYFDIARIVRENGYRIVHRHTGSAFGYFDLRAARYGGAKKMILHSHNNQAGNAVIHWLSNIFLKIPCEKWACSQEAGEWLFGKNTDFKVIKNAIECEKFLFDPEKRKDIRDKLGISDKFAIGHVGRFESQKNHQRLFEIFKEVHNRNQNTVLLCVGAGGLLEESKKSVTALGLEDSVLFLGTRTDINFLMQAFDIFLLPSLYEGFPFVLVEAQASGLQCVVSDHVPVECNITGNVYFESLISDNSKWAEDILTQEKIDRAKYADMLSDIGYDININANKLCECYKSMLATEEC